MDVLLSPPLIQTIIQQFQEEKKHTAFERFLFLPTKLTSMLASQVFLATTCQQETFLWVRAGMGVTVSLSPTGV